MRSRPLIILEDHKSENYRQNSVFRAHETVMRQVDMRTSPISEGGAHLRAGARKIAGIEDQRANARQCERRDVAKRQCAVTSARHRGYRIALRELPRTGRPCMAP